MAPPCIRLRNSFLFHWFSASYPFPCQFIPKSRKKWRRRWRKFWFQHDADFLRRNRDRNSKYKYKKRERKKERKKETGGDWIESSQARCRWRHLWAAGGATGIETPSKSQSNLRSVSNLGCKTSPAAFQDVSRRRRRRSRHLRQSSF